jgi:hypothetical protein
VAIEVTGYNKKSYDALIDAPLEGSLGGGTLEQNLGSVRNRGIEASVTAGIIETHAIRWDLTVGGSWNDNRLLKLAPGVTAVDSGVSYFAPFRQVAGYPLYGLWALPVHYQDANHDGLIEPNEVVMGDSLRFAGASLPAREMSVNSGLSLFRDRIRIAAQVDYRGGQHLANATEFSRSYGITSGALNDPTTPLSQQARAVAGTNDLAGLINAGFVEDASFVRWRELGVTYTLPLRLAHAVGGQTATVTLSGRNLAVWTHYTGVDPEVNSAAYYHDAQVASNGVLTPDQTHDVTGDVFSVPQLRYWILKVNLGL